MPNKYYNRSKRREQDLVREAKKDGKIGIRSAGSKSPIDVVIIDSRNAIIELIQVKTGQMSEKQIEALYNEYGMLTKKYKVVFDVCHFP